MARLLCARLGHDELRPRSRTGHAFFAPGHSFGLSIVEALDTLYLMGLDHELHRAADWTERHFDPVQDADVQVFEAVIRLVGGLLAGYRVTGRPVLLDRARELADRLLPAFTKSPTGIPFSHVNLRTGAVQGTTVALAEAGTNVMEFGLLSRLTGDSRYYDASMRSYRAVLARRSRLGLLGTFLDPITGRWLDRADAGPNPPTDSFYEYLWGGSRLLGDAQLGHWYRELTNSLLRHCTDASTGRLWFRTVDARTGKPSGPRHQSELASFYPGLLGKGGDLRRGRQYFASWDAAQRRWPLLPETLDYATLHAVDPGHQLRPEFANAAFDLWRITRSEAYRASAYRWFQDARRLRVRAGYTIATDVRPARPVLGDLLPAYWFAENLKYVYLMFAATPRFDYSTGLLSTEGKLLA
ncbi:glycoside hydrolase family 47 protein [Streptacidiphilus monticola]